MNSTPKSLNFFINCCSFPFIYFKRCPASCASLRLCTMYVLVKLPSIVHWRWELRKIIDCKLITTFINRFTLQTRCSSDNSHQSGTIQIAMLNISPTLIKIPPSETRLVWIFYYSSVFFFFGFKIIVFADANHIFLLPCFWLLSLLNTLVNVLFLFSDARQATTDLCGRRDCLVKQNW